MSSRGRALAGACAAVLSLSCASDAYRNKPRLAVVDGDPVVQMEKPGGERSLDSPRLVPLRQSTDPPFRNEKILGVALGEPARMYPIGLLDEHTAVNDEAGGVPFVVARSTLANLTTVLDRRVAGRTLTFEDSGALWRDVLVLRDRETGTLWTPVTGRAISGALAGETLAVLPAAVTTAEAWRELYPSTLCLETGELTAVALRLRLYAGSDQEGASGKKATDLRFPPKDTVMFIVGTSEALAFASARVREKKNLAATLEGETLTIEWDGGLRAPRAWRQIAATRQEVPVVPIYWFALLEQFATVQTLAATATPPPR